MRYRLIIGIIALTVLAWAPEALAQEPESLEQLIGSLYSASVRVVGLAAFLMFLFAGVWMLWPFSDKDPETRRKEAFQMMWDAAWGTVLLLSAVIILNSINPDTTSQEPVFRDGRFGIQGRISDIFIIE